MAHYDNPYTKNGVKSINDSFVDNVMDEAGKAAKSGAKTVGKAAGKGIAGGVRLTGRAGIGVGKAAVKGTRALGNFSINVGVNLARNTVESLKKPAGFQNPIGAVAKGFHKATTGMVDVEGPRTVWDSTKGALVDRGPKIKLTGKGKLFALGAGLIASTIAGSQASEQRHMGTIDSSQVYTATPDFAPKQYSQNLDYGGATGDLVFALFANRRGHRY